ncbi:MAG: ABC transporter ATP-binding protein [Desulfobulbus oligotrophicus]|jgi:iron complex transport system ATP-binding protein|nr:ABC transporter ATP-binding protein [Desulfobulbus oligotrophicus]
MQLEAVDVAVTFGKSAVLKAIRFSLAHHRFVGIIGPNGSGKSTLLKTFYKVIRPTSGVLTLDGHDVGKVSQRQCSRLLAILPQQQMMDVELTAEEVVEMGRYPHKTFFEQSADRERSLVKTTFADMQLEHLAERRLPTLSGGERQMVLIARAIVQDTPCILLDEPTNHLDIYHQVTILDALTALGKQVVVVFHDLNLAGKYCDYLYLMHKGEIVARGTPAEVLTRLHIKNIYNLDVDIISHPQSGRPVVVL